MPNGKLIVIEGGEGAGKNTQQDLLKVAFGDDDFVFVKDPGTTEIGLNLRSVLLHNESVGYETELLLYLAARAQLVYEQIKPALAAGKHVVANRFDLSTVAYQIYGREHRNALESLKHMSSFALAGVSPDLVIFLDLPPEEGLRRVGKRDELLNKFEKIDLSFHERVRAGYKKHIGDYPNHLIVDATKSREDIHSEIVRAVKTLIGAD